MSTVQYDTYEPTARQRTICTIAVEYVRFISATPSVSQSVKSVFLSCPLQTLSSSLPINRSPTTVYIQPTLFRPQNEIVTYSFSTHLFFFIPFLHITCSCIVPIVSLHCSSKLTIKSQHLIQLFYLFTFPSRKRILRFSF